MIIYCDVIKIDTQAEDLYNINNIIFKISSGKNITADNAEHPLFFLNTLISGGAQRIIMDMSGLEYIDSSGIGVFIHAAKQLRAGKGNIVFFGVPEQIEEIFSIVQLQKFIEMYNTKEEAISFFKE